MPVDPEAREQTRIGAWVTAVYKAFAPYDQTAPVFDQFEATIQAAKAGSLLSSIRSLGDVSGEQFEVYRRLSRLKPREAETILTRFQNLSVLSIEKSLVDGEEKIHSVKSSAISRSSVFRAVGKLFALLEPSDQERATVEALELTLPVPVAKSSVLSHLGQRGYPKKAAQSAIDQLIALELIGQTAETLGGTPILYNPYAYASPAIDVPKILGALKSVPHEKALTLLEHIKTKPGVPIPDDTDSGILNLLVKTGIIDNSAILARGGTHQKEFATLPQVWGVFGADSEDGLSKDLIDDSKLFLNSLRYGQFYSASSRGRIDDPWVLTDRLIRRGEVGPATAIGEDYPLPLARGIVSVVESRIHPGRFHMQLRKTDVAEAVRDILEQSAILPDRPKVTTNQLGTTGEFFAPEMIRIQKQLPTEMKRAADALAFELRTYRRQ
jgi:hypothetical protein